jgi:DNA-binding transcriptional LysR family regulator
LPLLKLDIGLTLSELSSQEVLRALQNRELDIGISRHQVNSDHLVQKKLFSDYFCLFWNSKHKVKETDKIEAVIRSLRTECFYHYGHGSGMDYLYEELGISISRMQYIEYSDWNQLLLLASRNGGWGICPSSYLFSYQGSLRTRKLSLSQQDSIEYFLYYQKELTRLEWAQNFLENLKKLRRT